MPLALLIGGFFLWKSTKKPINGLVVNSYNPTTQTACFEVFYNGISFKDCLGYSDVDIYSFSVADFDFYVQFDTLNTLSFQVYQKGTRTQLFLQENIKVI